MLSAPLDLDRVETCYSRIGAQLAKPYPRIVLHRESIVLSLQSLERLCLSCRSHAVKQGEHEGERMEKGEARLRSEEVGQSI